MLAFANMEGLVACSLSKVFFGAGLISHAYLPLLTMLLGIVRLFYSTEAGRLS